MSPIRTSSSVRPRRPRLPSDMSHAKRHGDVDSFATVFMRELYHKNTLSLSQIHVLYMHDIHHKGAFVYFGVCDSLAAVFRHSRARALRGSDDAGVVDAPCDCAYGQF